VALPPPAFTYKSKLADPTATTRIFERIINTPISMPIHDLLANSGELHKIVVEQARTHRIANTTTPRTNQDETVATLNTNHSLHIPKNLHIAHYSGLLEIPVVVHGIQESALLDEESEVVLMRLDAWKERQNRAPAALVDWHMTMETASREKQMIQECAEYLPIVRRSHNMGTRLHYSECPLLTASRTTLAEECPASETRRRR
jgi:hypothetical protein